MFAIALVASAFHIDACPRHRIAMHAFEIFRYAKEVEKVDIRCTECDAGYCVDSTLVLRDERRLQSQGVACRQEKAYHKASASALYALEKLRREEEVNSF